MPCHPSFWKHNSLLSCRSKSTSVDLDPCVPLSLPIYKLEMSYVWEKNSLFVLLQAAKHTKNSKLSLFLMEIDTKGQLLTKLQKSKHFKAEFVMTEFMGSKVKRNRVGDYLCYNAYRQKYQKLLIRSNCSFEEKSFLNRESHALCSFMILSLV